jgi:hypothetical protein
VAGPGRIYFLTKHLVVRDLRIRTRRSKGICLPDVPDAPPLIFAFVSPKLELNEAILDNSLLAAQVGDRKN